MFTRLEQSLAHRKCFVSSLTIAIIQAFIMVNKHTFTTICIFQTQSQFPCPCAFSKRTLPTMILSPFLPVKHLSQFSETQIRKKTIIRKKINEKSSELMNYMFPLYPIKKVKLTTIILFLCHLFSLPNYPFLDNIFILPDSQTQI